MSRVSDITGFYTFSETINSNALKNTLSTIMPNFFDLYCIVSIKEGLIHLYDPATAVVCTTSLKMRPSLIAGSIGFCNF